MEFTALFLAVAIVMLAAWRGPRSLALPLFAAVLLGSIATYLHHATDTLKLSFCHTYIAAASPRPQSPLACRSKALRTAKVIASMPVSMVGFGTGANIGE
jgi:hypothetical protein